MRTPRGPRQLVAVVVALALGSAAVALSPARLHEPVLPLLLPWLPLDGWSAVHLLTTLAVARAPTPLRPRTRAQFWLLVAGWEVWEQLVMPAALTAMRMPRTAARFRETWGDVASDLLVALPAAWTIGHHM